MVIPRLPIQLQVHQMPQRGNGLQPKGCRYPGNSKKRIINRNAVASFASFSQKDMHKANATALRLRTRLLSLPRVAEAATLGWRPLPPWGIH